MERVWEDGKMEDAQMCTRRKGCLETVEGQLPGEVSPGEVLRTHSSPLSWIGTLKSEKQGGVEGFGLYVCVSSKSV